MSVTSGFRLHSWDAHLVFEVRHDVGRAFLRRVLERLSEPSCDTVWRLSADCSGARVFLLWRPIHHDRGDVFLPISEPNGSRSSVQLRRCIECSCHGPRFPGSLARKDGHSWETCSRIVSAHTPISLRSAAHAEQR